MATAARREGRVAGHGGYRARHLVAVLGILAALVLPGVAAGDEWLPHAAGATWTYEWKDSQFSPAPTKESVTVKSDAGSTFTLGWTTGGLGNPAGAVTSSGTVKLQETTTGLQDVDWTGTAPPPDFPVLCAQRAQCGNALSSTFFLVIWGSRHPVLAEPLVKGSSWSSTGGAADDVSSTSVYQGNSEVTVPAFHSPVTAAVVDTKITQAGALGDPYGSGTRRVWWVAGVGPVKVEFDHAGGSDAPVTTAVLESTNQKPSPPPSGLDYLPFLKGAALTYQWTNSKYLRTPEIERFTVDDVVNRTARFKVASVSGPIKVAGTYGFSESLDGVTNLWGSTSSATTLKFPPLGPAGATTEQRNHFVTPFDLMTFGFNPLISAYPVPGQKWASKRPSNDFSNYGVTGETAILGTQTVTVPAGTFQALVVRTTLSQPGFPYGSGTRTSWFAPGTGLVKLVFDHGDHSVSTVELLK
jgi:hypothetical protein